MIVCGSCAKPMVRVADYDPEGTVPLKGIVVTQGDTWTCTEGHHHSRDAVQDVSIFRS